MSPNNFGECILYPSASQLHHKLQEVCCQNQDNTAPPTIALYSKLLPSQNGCLTSRIYHNSQGEILVWFDCCINVLMLSDMIYSHHHCMFMNFFVFLSSHRVINEKMEDPSRHQNEPIRRQHSPRFLILCINRASARTFYLGPNVYYD